MTKKAFGIPADPPMFAATQSGYESYGYSPAVRAGNFLFIAAGIDISSSDGLARYRQSDRLYQRRPHALRRFAIVGIRTPSVSG